jgi:asparagine synthetase B (glutamine-hydrolysing)
VRRRKILEETISRTPIDPDFASRIDLRDRLQRLYAFSSSRRDSAASRRRGSLQSPGLIVARERYDRVAGALAIEPRDPFMDVRVMEFCLRLPGDQLVRDGWPKYILRRSMDGLLPEAVRWRRGKEHLGPNFTEAVLKDTGLLPGPGERMSLPAAAQSYAGKLNSINLITQSTAEHDWRSIARSKVMTLSRWLELQRGQST